MRIDAHYKNSHTVFVPRHIVRTHIARAGAHTKKTNLHLFKNSKRTHSTCLNSNERSVFFFLDHKTVVVVNALSARVTEGAPLNNTLSL